jgi:hypothetical protein
MSNASAVLGILHHEITIELSDIINRRKRRYRGGKLVRIARVSFGERT